MSVAERHGEIAGQLVVEQLEIGRSLDIGVPAQGHHPAPGRPILPRRSWSMQRDRMFCTPLVCWVRFRA